MSNRIVQVAVNSDGDVWAIDSYERIWFSAGGGASRNWSTPTNGRAVQIAANENFAFCINRANQLFWIGAGNSLWNQWVGAPPARFVSIGPNNQVGMVDVSGNILLWDTTLPTPAWRAPDVRGIAVNLSVFDMEVVYCVNVMNEIYWLKNGDEWTRWSGQNGSSVSVIPNAGATGGDRWNAWVVDVDGSLKRFRNGSGIDAPATGGRAIQVAAVSAEHIWVVNAQGQLWQWTSAGGWVQHRIPFPGIIHIVRPGDSLSAIARLYNVTLNAVISANPQIKNPDLIFPGQEVIVPV